MLTRPQSRPLLVGAVFLFFVTGGLSWLEGYVSDQYVAVKVSRQLVHGSGGWSDPQMDSVLNDSLLIFGGLVILLAPLTLAIAETGPWRCKIDASGRLWPCRSPTLTAPSSMPRSLPPPHGQTKSPDTAPGSFWRSPRRLAGHRVFDYARQCL